MAEPLGPIGIVADDLTGAGDTALQFWLPGREVWILPDAEARAPDGAEVLSINTDSRHCAPDTAADRLEAGLRVLARAGVRRVYKKVDSTMRGNVAAEIRRAIALLGCDAAIVAPAFPEAGRLTVGGYQLVDGVPVSASPYARDPLSPVTESHVPTLLSGALGETVGHVGLNTVMKGPEAIAGALVAGLAQGVRVLVADAARHEDLLAVARAIAMTPYRVLPVGSAGLARALLPHRLLGAPAGQELLLGARAPVLVVAGSVNPVTTAQVRHMAATARVVPVDVEGLLLTDETASERLVASVLPLLLANRDVVLTTNGGEDALRKGTQLGRDLMMGAVQTGEQLAQALGGVVARLVARAELSGLVLAGGETARGVCRALGGRALRVEGPALPAMPLCRLEGPDSSVRVVFKSGGFGAPTALADIVERLKRMG